MEKISKQCVIHLTSQKIEFILASDISDGVQVWSGMNVVCFSVFACGFRCVFTNVWLQESLFEDYKIESMSNNELSFDIQLTNLHRALKSAQFATEVIMKLTKNRKGLPILSICIEAQVYSCLSFISIDSYYFYRPYRFLQLCKTFQSILFLLHNWLN